MNKIQILATIGPACSDSATIKSMIESGMSMARLNFSWGNYNEHRVFVSIIREIAEDQGINVPIFQDLSGPRIQQGKGHTFDSDIDVITSKDKLDIQTMADLGIEYVALSFVKDADDVRELRTLLTELGSVSKIVAKIERKEALANLDSIIAEADGVMIARGDLGDAIPVETLPFVKKDILKRCQIANKPAIVATEMLTSMIDSDRPTRADVSDIANAVLDGASATMLSNETAVGSNPVETIEMMRRVIDEAQIHTKISNLVYF